MAGLRIIIFLLVISYFSGNVLSEPVSVSDQKEIDRINREFYQAQRLESEQKYDEALAIFESLYKTSHREAILWKIISIYEITGKLDKLENLVKESVRENPADMTLANRLARIYFSKGDRAKGKEILYELIGSRWHDKERVSIVAGNFMDMGDIESAIDVYIKARKETDEPEQYSTELARAYLIIGEYSKAFEEYLSAVRKDPIIYGTIDRAVKSALENGKDPDEISPPFLKYMDKNPADAKAMRILSDILASGGKYELSLELFKKCSFASGDSSLIFNFAEKMRLDGRKDISYRAYHSYSEMFPSSPKNKDALFNAAMLENEMGLKNDAYEDFRKIEHKYVGTPEAEYSSLKILEYDEKNLKDNEYIDQLEKKSKESKSDLVLRRVYLLLGDKYLKTGDFDKSKPYYIRASEKSRSPKDIIESSVRLINYNLFIGDYESVKPEIEKCMANGADNKEINDILSLKVLLLRCNTQREKENLKKYMAGKYEIFRNNYKAAADSFSAVCLDSTSVLSSYGYRELGIISSETGQKKKAVEFFLKSASVASDITIKTRSEMYAADLLYESGDRKNARELYMKILLDSQGSVFESELRNKIKEIDK